MEIRTQIITAGISGTELQPIVEVLGQCGFPPPVRQVTADTQDLTLQQLLEQWGAQPQLELTDEGLLETARPIAVLAFFERDQYGPVMELFKEQLPTRPVFGGLTPTNIEWRFSALVKELSTEAEEFAARSRAARQRKNRPET